MFKFIKSTRLSVVLLAVTMLLIFLHYFGILRPVENLIVWILSPVQQRVYWVGAQVNNFSSHLASQGNLDETNAKLQQEVNRLTIENAQLKTMISENQQLADQKIFLQSNNLPSITAEVIGKNPEPNLQTMILNKGANDGVKVGFPVITGGGIMVGKISAVNGNSAQVILLNDSGSRVAALIQNEASSKGVVSGEHGLSLKMELIPQNEAVKIDDVVVTSGLELNIPRGLVIGKISRVDTEANNFFQTAWLQYLVKIDNLTLVSILKMPNL